MLASLKRLNLLPILIAVGMVYPVVRMVIQRFAPVGLLVPCGLVVVWLIWRVRRPRQLLATPLGLPLLLCGVALVASSLLSPSPRASVLAMLFHWGAVAVLLFLSVDLLAQGCPPRWFAIGAIVMASFALLSGLAQVAGWVAGWLLLWRPGEPLLPVSYRPFIVGSHPNQAVMLFYLGLPFVVAAWWQATRRWQQVCWAIWVLVAVLLIFVTGSRGGWLGTAALVGLMLTPLLLAAVRARAWRRVGWTLGLLCGYTLLFGALFVANQQAIAAQRGGSLLNPTGRTLFWSHALELFVQRPLLGAGPTGYAVYYNTVEPASRLFRPGHAHNIYLMTLSEMGIIGCAALLLLLAAAGRIWWRGWRQAPALAAEPCAASEPRLLMLASAAALGGLAIHGLVDVPVPQISGMALYIGAAGLAYGLTGDHRRGAKTQRQDIYGSVSPCLCGDTQVRSSWHLPHPLHLAIGTLVLVTWGLCSWIFVQDRRADQLAAQGQQIMLQGDIRSAFERATVALTTDPGDDSAQRVRALALARLAQDDPRLLPNAIAAQELTARTIPVDHVTPLNRAILLAAQGRVADAEIALRRVIEDDTSGWGLPYLLLADLEEQGGDVDAPLLWREALRRQPDLATSAACRSSSVCATLPIPESDVATLRVLRPRLVQRDLSALTELEELAQQRLSVDLWAAAALAAIDMGDEHRARRSLRAAVDQSQMIGSAPTRLLGLALLRDALRRDDRAALRALVARWAAPADLTLVPQITVLTTTETDGQIAVAALEAARRLGDAGLLRQAQTYGRAVQQALAAPPLQSGSR